MKSFGAKVKEQRGNLGLSQKQLAEKAGMVWGEAIKTNRRHCRLQKNR